MLQLNLLSVENTYPAGVLLGMSGDLPDKKVCSGPCGLEKDIGCFGLQTNKDGSEVPRSQCKACNSLSIQDYLRRKKLGLGPKPVVFVPETKVCLGPCGRDLPLGSFEEYKEGKFGRRSRCKECRAQEEKERRAANPPTEAQRVEAAQRTRDWYAANRDRVLASSVKWMKDHLEEFEAIQRRYRSKPETKIKLAERNKVWATQNRDKTREYARVWRAQNRELYHEIQKRWRAENQTYWRIRDKAIRSTQSDFTLDQWLEVLEEFGHCCAYCLRPDVKLTMDHIISIAKGGTHTRDNIVPACKSCNSRKKDRPIFYMLGFNGV